MCVCVCVCVCEEAEERGKSHLDHLNLMSIKFQSESIAVRYSMLCMPAFYCKASHYISFRNEFLVHDWKTFIIFHILEQGPLKRFLSTPILRGCWGDVACYFLLVLVPPSWGDVNCIFFYLYDFLTSERKTIFLPVLLSNHFFWKCVQTVNF